MMKKKVKKIPKYNAGGSVLDTLLKNNPLSGNPMGSTNNSSTNNFSKFSDWKGTSTNPWKDMTSTQKTGAVIDAVGAIGQGLGVATSGQDVNVGTALSTAAGMAGAGMTIGGPIGAAIGAGVGAIMGTAGRKVGYDADSSSTNFDDIYDPGSGWLSWFGHKGDAKRKANLVLNSNISKIQSENIKEMYSSNPNVTFQPITAAEGGIMRLPVDALVSKGELIYDPVLKKLTKIPGNKGKANTDDDVFVELLKGLIVVPNSNNSKKLTTNDKTLAYNLEPMVDKPNRKMSKGTIEARDRIIKKASRLNELIKDKPQEYAKFKDGWNGEIKTWGDYLKYQYNLSKGNKIDSLDNFWGYDSKNKKYTSRWDKIIEYIGENKELREKAIKDLSGLGYVGTGKDAWDNIVEAAYDTKPADVHRYFKSVGDVLLINEDALKPVAGISNVISVPKGISQKNVRSLVGGVDITNSYVPQQESEKLIAPPLKKVSGLMATYDKDIDDAYNSLRNRKRLPKLRQLGESISDFTPFAAAALKNYDYHSEPVFIGNRKYVPTYVSTDPTRRAIEDSYSLARYNQSNINPNTGAGMAYGLQAASNRAKSLADMYHWQTDTQNKLIAQNVGIYNDWEDTFAQARHIANTETRQNEGAAQQMKDSAIRDALEFTQGRRNDKILADMMKPMFEYGTPNEAYERIYKRRIV